VGESIRKHGLPRELAPFVVVFTSNGKASRGAQEVFELLPHQWVHPSELATLPPDCGHLFGCVVEAQDYVKHREGEAFSREEFYARGTSLYESTFHSQIAPYATAIINCTYWDARYPRLLTKQQFKDLHARKVNKLALVADISCDVGGSVEFLEKSTLVEKPFYLYTPEGECRDSLDGNGVVMMGVDILPSELPREASTHFGDLLVNLVRPLLASEASTDLKDLVLPPALHSAIITNNGELAPKYAYIQTICRERQRKNVAESPKMPCVGLDDDAASGRSYLCLRGHIFDTGLINKALDLIEEHKATFHLHECSLEPSAPDASLSACGIPAFSTAVIEVGCTDRAAVDKLVEELRRLAASTPNADASLVQLATYQGSSISNRNKDPAARGNASEALQQAQPQHERRRSVLCLGAGMVSEPLVEFLSRDTSTSVTVVSGVAGQAQALVERVARFNVTARTLDVLQDMSAVESLCARADCVVSLLPASMHVAIAETCIRTGTSLVTASYISDEMQQLHSRAQAAGICILGEMGLDPGIDHMSAMKMMDQVKHAGGTITSFASWCGGLPAPEAANNPLRYKFSWSPRGVLSAAQNSARFLERGVLVEVPGDKLLAAASSVHFLQAFALEALPNRDSLKYADIYGIPQASSIYRGTLRFTGFSGIMDELRQLGLLDSQPVCPAGWHKSPKTWGQLMESQLIKPQQNLSPQTRRCLEWLGVWSNQALERKSGWGVVDEFCALLEKRLSYAPGERDMVVMHHEIGVSRLDGSSHTRTCTLVAYGKPDMTIMATTVGLTAAAGASLILTGKLQATGVVRPTAPEVYLPTLQLLANEVACLSLCTHCTHSLPACASCRVRASAVWSENGQGEGWHWVRDDGR